MQTLPQHVSKLVCSMFLLLATTTFASDGDSTKNSGISFQGLEATLSSRIIHFRWDVETEENGSYFVIEKSLDQTNWSAVTKVQSVKNHDEQRTYEVSEIDFAEGVNEYFRIVRVDEYGEQTELDRINLNRPVLTNLLLIPSQKRINKETTISYDSMIQSRGTLTVYSEEGDIMFDKKINIAEGYNRFVIDIKSYDAGNYQIIVKDEYDNKISKRLVIH